MTGPEHYRQAEQKLADAAEVAEDGSGEERAYLAAAQVHATLALTAAHAISASGNMPVDDCDEWIATASVLTS